MATAAYPPERLSSKARRAALRKLLLTEGASTQSELCHLLSSRGFRVTQSTISRDLKLLGAERRLRDDGSLVYRLEGRGQSAFPSQMVVGIEHNETMILLRTRIGRAPAVGVELDQLRHPEILGTVAGDDTVLVIPRSISLTNRLYRTLRELADLHED